MFLLYLFIRKTERYLACAKSVLVFSQKLFGYKKTRLFGFAQYFSDWTSTPKQNYFLLSTELTFEFEEETFGFGGGLLDENGEEPVTELLEFTNEDLLPDRGKASHFFRFMSLVLPDFEVDQHHREHL